MDDLLLVFDPLPNQGLAGFLTDNVIRFNIARTGVSEWHPLGFFLKNPRGEYLGGVTGYIWGGWMHVDFLWVTENLRGQGLGGRLMDAAEAFAVEHGASAATLESHSFGAQKFYQNRGYEVFGRLDDYPPGHSKVFLRKQFNAESD